ncbi:putative RNA helicase [Naganishia cerealis]|uniref:RNA helicase n=1 Tax=Naganishia cerealis TaxID=610337 RepID=A0ACC2WJS1_9TREE|nr:putative RNA helicase [Naganishia cerealis]
MLFKDLGVSKWLLEALAAMKIRLPTSIQAECIPQILAGRDCIGGAKTGSGKTIAFAAPMMTKWSEDPFGIYGLVLTPTRELALQIAEQFLALGASMNIKVAVVVGGEDMVKQALEIQKSPHFIIATPGRLADHILNSGDDTVGGLKRIKFLVLDEADRLLSNSFGSDLERCFKILPDASKRQTLLFTATVTDAVRALKDKPVPEGKKPVFIHEIVSKDQVAIPATLTISYVFVPSYVKEAYLHNILVLPKYEKALAIVFVNRTYTAEILRRTLRKLDIRVASLHSEMPQSERTNSLHRFRAGAARVLIATDVASRGLDIPNVELVVNQDIPADPDDYIHRVGRTARAGKKGDSVSIVSEKDVERILAIENHINKKMDLLEEVNDDKIIKESLSIVTAAKRESVADMEKEGFGEKRKINKRKREERTRDSKKRK